MSDSRSDDKRGADMNHTLMAVQDSMLDGLGQLSAYFGFNKVMGQLYGALLLSPGPMSLDDLMERLNISKANVSMNMRTLEHMGMVRQVWIRGRGDRRKYYEAETDFGQIIANILSGREMRDVDRALAIMKDNVEQLQETMPKMSEADSELAKLYVERIQQIQAMFQFAHIVIASVLERVSEIDFSDISSVNIDYD
ncbi:MAG: ArsR family transcriptional regulator [Chloroflexi bacterium]|nr:MAG: hypothetical protein CUN54_04855 [Phototrophicales bacterium]RMF81809.1 MAG: ArsR family transcriptional regulator [Chloroflexota bacterium]